MGGNVTNELILEMIRERRNLCTLQDEISTLVKASGFVVFCNGRSSEE